MGARLSARCLVFPDRTLSVCMFVCLSVCLNYPPVGLIVCFIFSIAPILITTKALYFFKMGQSVTNFRCYFVPAGTSYRRNDLNIKTRTLGSTTVGLFTQSHLNDTLPRSLLFLSSLLSSVAGVVFVVTKLQETQAKLLPVFQHLVLNHPNTAFDGGWVM